MAKVFLHCFYIITVFKRIRCEAVPKIMESLFAMIDFAYNLFVVLVDCDHSQTGAIFSGKYEIPRITPLLPSQFFYDFLVSFLFQQKVHNGISNNDRSCFSVFRSVDAVFSDVPVYGKLLPYH